MLQSILTSFEDRQADLNRAFEGLCQEAHRTGSRFERTDLEIAVLGIQALVDATGRYSADIIPLVQAELDIKKYPALCQVEGGLEMVGSGLVQLRNTVVATLQFLEVVLELRDHVAEKTDEADPPTNSEPAEVSEG